MAIKDELVKIVGSECISDDPGILESYSKDYSLTSPKKPVAIVKVKNPDDALRLVLSANENGIPIYPSSSKVHFYGGTIPRRDGAIIMDLSEMNKIVEIDERNRWVHIEPGVTWEQIQSVLEKKGFRSVIPLLPHAERSVLMDLLEREQPTACKFEYSEMVASMWVIWGLGEKFVTGSAAVNTFRQIGCYADGVNVQGPGTLDFWRFLQGAQGTLGIVTKGICKIEYLPVATKTFFFPADKVEELINPFYTIGHRYVGYERFILNNVTAAGILGDYNLKNSLPDWMGIIILAGLPVGRPQEMVDYQVDYIQNGLKKRFPTLNIAEKIDKVHVSNEERLAKMLTKPWPREKVYWKHAYKGNCHELIFMSPLKRAPEFVNLIYECAKSYGYSTGDVGIYIQPIEDMRACQIDFIFHYNPNNPNEVEVVRKVHQEATLRAVNYGAYFNRIYDGVAEVVFSLPRVQGYVNYIRRVKRLLDPNEILSPGKLCF